VGPDIQKMVRQGRDLTELPGIRTDFAIRKVGIATTGSCTCLTICDIACRQRSSSSVAYRVWARSGSVFFTRDAAYSRWGNCARRRVKCERRRPAVQHPFRCA
jgi:hypothetical protein